MGEQRFVSIIFRSKDGSVFQFDEEIDGSCRVFFANCRDYSERFIPMSAVYDRYDSLIKSGWRLDKSNITKDELFELCLSLC